MIKTRALWWLAAALLVPGMAHAQEAAEDDADAPAELGAVTVTATRTETAIGKTPIAVTAISQEDLTREGVTDIRDAADMIPNFDVAFSPSDSGVQLTIRGINSNNFTEIADPSVAFHVDGVYSPRPQGAIALMYDLERLEVSRGPQGTLFGRNSAAGSINVVTAKPSFDGAFSTVGFEVGNRNHRNMLATINAPISDTFAVRANFFGEQRDGFADQGSGDKDLEGIGLSGPDGIPDMDQRWNHPVDEGEYYGNADRWAARISTLWEPSDRFSWRLTYETYEDKAAGWGIAPNCDHNPEVCEYNGGGIDYVDPNVPGEMDMTIDSVRSHVDWMLTDSIDVIYNLGWARQERSQRWDGDMGWRAVPGEYTGWLNRQPPWPELYLATAESHYESWSNELQFQGNTGPVSWLLGFFDFRENNDIIFDVELPFCCSTGLLGGISFVQPERTLESQAIFGQATWHFTEKWHFTAGFRYTEDTRQDKGGKNYDCFGGAGCSWSAGRIPNDGDPSDDQLDELILPLYTSADLGPGMGAQNRFVNYSEAAQNDNKEEFDNFDWRIGIDYDLSRKSFMYVVAATGSKAGSFGDQVNTCNCEIDSYTRFFPYEPEKVTNYEFGYKGTLFSDTLYIQLAAFWTDYTDKQVSQFRTVGYARDNDGELLDPLQPIGTLITSNAGEATIKGIELEFDWLTPWEGGRFTGYVAWLDATFDSWPGYAGEAYFCDERADAGAQYACIPEDDGTGAVDIEGNELPYSSPLQMTARYTHDFYLASGATITPFVKVHWQDETHMTEGNFDALKTYSDKRDAFATVDMTLRYTSAKGNWWVEAFGYNVTDERFQTYLSDWNAAGVPLFAWNAPRSYGMRFAYSMEGF